jgi:hypothetical protein
VPKASAVVPGVADVEPIAIMADHINMAKFSSMEDDGFCTISGHLSLMVKDCAAKIETNWRSKDNMDKSKLEHAFIHTRMAVYQFDCLYGYGLDQ